MTSRGASCFTMMMCVAGDAKLLNQTPPLAWPLRDQSRARESLVGSLAVTQHLPPRIPYALLLSLPFAPCRSTPLTTSPWLLSRWSRRSRGRRRTASPCSVTPRGLRPSRRHGRRWRRLCASSCKSLVSPRRSRPTRRGRERERERGGGGGRWEAGAVLKRAARLRGAGRLAVGLAAGRESEPNDRPARAACAHTAARRAHRERAHHRDDHTT